MNTKYISCCHLKNIQCVILQITHSQLMSMYLQISKLQCLFFVYPDEYPKKYRLPFDMINDSVGILLLRCKTLGVMQSCNLISLLDSETSFRGEILSK